MNLWVLLLSQGLCCNSGCCTKDWIFKAACRSSVISSRCSISAKLRIFFIFSLHYRWWNHLPLCLQSNRLKKKKKKSGRSSCLIALPSRCVVAWNISHPFPLLRLSFSWDWEESSLNGPRNVKIENVTVSFSELARGERQFVGEEGGRKSPSGSRSGSGV